MAFRPSLCLILLLAVLSLSAARVLHQAADFNPDIASNIAAAGPQAPTPLVHPTGIPSVDDGFSSGWWNAPAESLAPAPAVVLANAQIWAQGCTPTIEKSIQYTVEQATNAGQGKVITQIFETDTEVGPGLSACYHNMTQAAVAAPTEQWIEAQGFSL